VAALQVFAIELFLQRPARRQAVFDQRMAVDDGRENRMASTQQGGDCTTGGTEALLAHVRVRIRIRTGEVDHD
jgi:hypothetical protein